MRFFFVLVFNCAMAVGPIALAKGDASVPSSDRRQFSESIDDKSGARWVTESDSVAITGDRQSADAEAHSSWKNACERWKMDFRDENRDAKILDLNCGKEVCGADGGLTKCVSTAAYKIKTKID